MHAVDVSRIDLNLLVVLDALLEAGSVTHAAQRLGVGQPAASHALTRLRALLGDPLLVRSGRRLAPTPRAEALREPLARLLAEAARLVRHEVSFDPARSRRTFSLVCPDLLAAALPRLVSTLGRQAPGARLDVLPPQSDDLRALEDGRRDVALVPTPSAGAGLVQCGLGRLHFAVFARADHPALVRGTRRLTRAAWAQYPHVQVRTGHGGRSIVATALAKAEFERRVGLVVPSFLAALTEVAESELFLTAPRELAAPLAAHLDVVWVEPPLTLPPVPVSAVWHERVTADPAHQFFRGQVVEVLRAVIGARTAERSTSTAERAAKPGPRGTRQRRGGAATTR
jgi:DNA-binding transcriptional LysR family regulator